MKFSGIAPAIGSIATVLLTTNFHNPMGMVNKWTPLVLGFTAVGAGLAVAAQAKSSKAKSAAKA